MIPNNSTLARRSSRLTNREMINLSRLSGGAIPMPCTDKTLVVVEAKCLHTGMVKEFYVRSFTPLFSEISMTSHKLEALALKRDKSIALLSFMSMHPHDMIRGYKITSVRIEGGMVA